MKPKNFPTHDRSSRCQGDKQLRELGYRIAARPNDGEPLWERGGVLFLESAIWEMIERDRLRAEATEAQVVS
jgi:hypothetical protein